MTHVLAIDQGTTSSRAIVFDADLKPVSSAPRELHLVLVALQPVLDIHRGRRRLKDRKESLHILFVVVVRE